MVKIHQPSLPECQLGTFGDFVGNKVEKKSKTLSVALIGNTSKTKWIKE